MDGGKRHNMITSMIRDDRHYFRTSFFALIRDEFYFIGWIVSSNLRSYRFRFHAKCFQLPTFIY